MMFNSTNYGYKTMPTKTEAEQEEAHLIMQSIINLACEEFKRDDLPGDGSRLGIHVKAVARYLEPYQEIKVFSFNG